MSWITDLFKKKEKEVKMSEKSFLAWTHAMESMANAQNKALDYLVRSTPSDISVDIRKNPLTIDECIQEQPVELEFKPKLVLSNNTLVAVLSDGTIWTCAGDQNLFNACSTANNKEELRELMFPGVIAEEKQIKQKAEKEAKEKELQKQEELKQLVKKEELVKKTVAYTDILVNSGEFVVKNDCVYMVGIDIAIPKLLLDKFVKLVDKVYNGVESKIETYEKEYQALKNFWRWTSLCPNPQSREDMFKFLEKHDFKINKHGFFFAYRRVQSVSTAKVDTSYIKGISELKTKVKSWKKAAVNYDVYLDGKVYQLKDLKKNKKVTGKLLGNLATLYNNLSSEETGQAFTDAHSYTMDIRIGKEVSMPRKDCDENNNNDCSKGLHIGNKNFSFSGNGDTPILVLINPMNAVSIPKYDSNKMRVCAYYPVSVLSGSDKDMVKFLEKTDVTELGDEYFLDQVDKLEELVKNNTPKELGDKRIIAEEQTVASLEVITETLAVEVKSLKELAKEAMKNKVVKS